MTLHDNRGSIMLETVLVLPIFVLIIFFLIQITFVWTAKQMTYYAAYCGARAALVYNPADYNAEQQDDGSWKSISPKGGVVHQAACTALSWISWSLSGNDWSDFRIGNSYSVPLSSTIREQVFVQVKEFEKISESKKSSSSSKEEPAKIADQFPAVTITVQFRCPLFIPLGGPLIAYFFGANDQVCLDTSNAIGVGGFSATSGNRVHNQLIMSGNYTKRGDVEYYSILLSESCTLAKPYKTDTFPLMSPEDKAELGMIY